jgi:hypothetical protein
VWFFTRYEDVRAVLSRFNSEAMHPGFPNETPAARIVPLVSD